ncbi:MAG: DNA-directed RNA polymerase subunit omega [Clostridiales bacterium]|nr:DNA-directed RNA polymerase subunit omega [Clostridiales bacterium]MCI7702782.1 DNA-directed RNA polymerase subunit omega [Clostridiales bacterium]MDY3763023.1 DNA-directed RNA polymerase subunit omega [Candidatus Ventricola sp.]MDY3831564.1 DNA-directed RNA polymerase subunit omega [Candidatus Ventricola sp.]MDY4541308.1 DNA-directed RNA polymerase subunit omega [Candidatus Ventricola sp.]
MFMSMTNPTILQLLEKADCRYTLVVEVSKRARQLVDGIPPLIDAKDKENMPVSIAIDEVNRGLISYERTTENDAR